MHMHLHLDASETDKKFVKKCLQVGILFNGANASEELALSFSAFLHANKV